MKRLYRLHLIGLGLLWSISAAAVELSSTVSLHGYASLIGARADGNPWTTYRTLDRWDWARHEAVLALNWSISDDTRLTASVISRRQGDMEKGELRLQTFSLNHVMQSGVNQLWGIRLGRVKNTLLGFYSNQSVPSERDGVILPVPYEGVVSELFEAMDGASVYGEWSNEAGDLVEWQLYGGVRKDLDLTQQEYRMFQGKVSGGLTDLSLVGAKVSWTPARYPNVLLATYIAGGRENLGHGQSVAEAVQKALSGACVRNPAACITDHEARFNIWGVSGRGIWGRWSLTAEAGAVDVTAKTTVVNQTRTFKATAYAGHLQVGYAPRRKLQFWLRGEGISLSKKPQIVRTFYNYYTRGLTLAGRYYWTPNWFITAQISHYDGNAALQPFKALLRPQKREWNLYLLSLTYQF